VDLSGRTIFVAGWFGHLGHVEFTAENTINLLLLEYLGLGALTLTFVKLTLDSGAEMLTTTTSGFGSFDSPLLGVISLPLKEFMC